MKWPGRPPGRRFSESTLVAETNGPGHFATCGPVRDEESCHRTSAIETSTPSSHADPYPRLPQDTTTRGSLPTPRLHLHRRRIKAVCVRFVCRIPPASVPCPDEGFFGPFSRLFPRRVISHWKLLTAPGTCKPNLALQFQ